MATLINDILISLDLKTIVQAHGLCIDMIPSDPDVSKCNQSRWHHARHLHNYSLHGLEMGHPVTVGQSSAHDFSVTASRKLFFLSSFRTVLSAIHMQVTDRPSLNAPSLTQATRSLVALEPRRPPMTDVGTETAFRLDQRKLFRKSKHLLRSEVKWCDQTSTELHLRRSTSTGE